MEQLDIDGLFWLVDKPEDKVAGRLTFNPVDGAVLNLVGTFKGFVPSGSNPPVHMNAIAGGRQLTLDNCHFEQVKLEYMRIGQTGLTRHQYRTDLILDGWHRHDPKPLNVKNTLLHLRYIEQWVHVFSGGPIGYEDRADNTPRISHQFDSFQRIEAVNIGIGELGLSYGQTKYWEHFLESTVRRNCYLDLRLNESVSFAEMMNLCWMLQDLITLGCDYPSAITGMTLEHPQQNPKPPTENHHSIVPYMRTTGHYSSKSYDDVSNSNIMFAFSDIGGVKGVGKWLEVATRYRVSIGYLVGNLYAPSPYPEIQFFNACTAVEALRRMQIKKQNFNLSKELPMLARKAGDAFGDLVTNVDEWAKEVVKTRYNSVVHPGLGPRTDTNALIWLTDSLHLLAVLCLLNEMGVQTEAEKRVKRSNRFHQVNQMSHRLNTS